jgi:hypothetical protein
MRKFCGSGNRSLLDQLSRIEGGSELGSDGAVGVCPATSMETVIDHGPGEYKENDNQNDNPNEFRNSRF